MGLTYEVGDIVTLKRGIPAEAKTGRYCEWAQIFV